MMLNRPTRIQMRQLADTDVVNFDATVSEFASIDAVDASFEESVLDEANSVLNVRQDEAGDDDFTTLKNALRLKRPELYFQ